MNRMLSPCNCSGTIAYIHRECLINSIILNNEQFCRICEQNFNGIKIYKKYESLHKFLKESKNYSYVLLSLICITLSIMIIIFDFYSLTKREILFSNNMLEIKVFGFSITILMISLTLSVLVLIYILYLFMCWRNLNYRLFIKSNYENII
jgi:hypothetical protein